MAKIVTFGELMLRLQPYNYERFVQCDHVEFTFGGGEANVAVSLANYGMDAAFVTKLPAHAIGQAAVNSLRRYGVDTTKIRRGGNRVGIYLTRKAPLSVAPCVSMTEPTPLSKRPLPATSIGMPFLRAWIGSTSPVSPPLSILPWPPSALRLVKLPRKEILLFPATSTTAKSCGQEKRLVQP